MVENGERSEGSEENRTVECGILSVEWKIVSGAWLIVGNFEEEAGSAIDKVNVLRIERRC